jgi:hypothetical protein
MVRRISIFVLLAAAACAPPPEGGGGEAPEVEGPALAEFGLSAYCGSVAGAACFLAGLCNNQLLFRERHRDDRGCHAELKAQCLVEGIRYERGVAEGALEFDGNALRSCVGELGTAECLDGVGAWGLLSCDAVPGAPGCDKWFFGTALSESCQAVFQGTVGANGECWLADECAAGHYCLLTACTGSRARPGSCEPHVQRGDSCALKEQACAPGLVCTGAQMESMRCRPVAELGGDCMTIPGERKPTCARPLQCLVPNRGGTDNYGQCVAFSPAGGPCGSGRAPCASDSTCTYKSVQAPEGVCTEFLDAEKPCDVHLADFPCGRGLHCWREGSDPLRPMRAHHKGDCRPYPLDGQPCVANDQNCLDGYCTAGAPDFDGWCDPLRANGEECLKNQECASAECAAGGARGNRICSDRRDVLECVRPLPEE